MNIWNKFKNWLGRIWIKIKNWFKRILFVIASIFGFNYALAQDVTVTCTAPIQYTDNSPILSTETKIFNIYRDGVNVAQVTNICNYVDSLSPATYQYQVSVTINGIESGLSNTVTKIISFPTPKAPVLDGVD